MFIYSKIVINSIFYSFKPCFCWNKGQCSFDFLVNTLCLHFSSLLTAKGDSWDPKRTARHCQFSFLNLLVHFTVFDMHSLSLYWRFLGFCHLLLSTSFFYHSGLESFLFCLFLSIFTSTYPQPFCFSVVWIRPYKSHHSCFSVSLCVWFLFFTHTSMQ